MISIPKFETKLSFRVRESGSHTGISGVLAAAVVNRNFRDQLLENPRAALESGYLGEQFDLTSEEQSLLFSTRAASLTDLAQKIVFAQAAGD